MYSSIVGGSGQLGASGRMRAQREIECGHVSIQEFWFSTPCTACQSSFQLLGMALAFHSASAAGTARSTLLKLRVQTTWFWSCAHFSMTPHDTRSSSGVYRFTYMQEAEVLDVRSLDCSLRPATGHHAFVDILSITAYLQSETQILHWFRAQSSRKVSATERIALRCHAIVTALTAR